MTWQRDEELLSDIPLRKPIWFPVGVNYSTYGIVRYSSTRDLVATYKLGDRTPSQLSRCMRSLSDGRRRMVAVYSNYHFPVHPSRTFYNQTCLSYHVSSIENNVNRLRVEPYKSAEDLVNKVESEARLLPFEPRCNDMFTFKQSVDIVNLLKDEQHVEYKSSILVKLRSFLLSDVLPWLEKLTGAPLERDRIDFTSSIYGTHDVLLCHDDELDNRRIAFIWYLVPKDWDASVEGGCLELFSCQPEEQIHVPPIGEKPTTPIYPWKITASIPPRRNMFVFFEPSSYSFHQVTETLGSRDRLSLHGWFHGPPLPRPSERCHPTSVPLVSPVHVEEELVYRWINPFYLDMRQQTKIRRRFVKSSEIQLANFLKLEEWGRACNALSSVTEPVWSACGPFNRKHFDVLSEVSKYATQTDAVPEPLRELYRLFRSEAILVILSDLTGIRLHPSALASDTKVEDIKPPATKHARLEPDGDCVPNAHSTSPHTVSDPEMAALNDPQFRRWRTGYYTLLADSDVMDTAWRLECVLHLDGYGQPNAQNTTGGSLGDRITNWQQSWGGQLVYIARDEKSERIETAFVHEHSATNNFVGTAVGTARFEDHGQLLSVLPVDNSLTLVYTGPGTASFVKYINHAARPCSLKDCSDGPENCLSAFDLSVVYHEPVSEGHSGDESNAADNMESSGDEDIVDSELEAENEDL
ncbi:uncharacterized protein DEA37_0002555 [Paragonimus westermani]|uniref:Prolyl 4-hydroxylase alpha subunit domain-containing protein n=1 Tax=Paragonimus westermani TaxID=34504 RepID=A0A5J4NGA4_9TREM|nr:uncharacterized protein DEA37_0002555 [Paragonimus westermani]